MAIIEKLHARLNAHFRVGLKDVPKSEKSGRYAFNVAAFLGAMFTPLYMIGYAIGGAPLLSLVISPLCLFVFAPYCLKFDQTLTLSVFAAVLLGVFLSATYLTGASSGLYLFMTNGIIAVILLQSPQRPVQTSFFVALIFFLMVVSFLSFREPSGLLSVGEHFNFVVFIVSLSTILFQVTAILYSLNDQVARAEAALAAEHARSEALLQNLLPNEIVTRLKDNPGEVIADGLPDITLLFADIVDFTPRAARMSPEDLVGFLNHIFSAFDKLTEERGLEKIKTIGDAYMVAAGLPVAREDHAEIIADMALAMQAETVKLSQEMGEPVALRIGLHSGPAVAGVIGTSKVFYDVWGDTVNTASRMESHGEPGCIQATQATRAALAGSYAFEPRGKVSIKGIGEVETFWLAGRL